MRQARLLARFAVLIVLGASFLVLVPTASWASALGTNHGGVITNVGLGIDEPSGITSGPDGALWFTDAGNNSIGRISTSGVMTSFTGPIHHPFDITAGPDGALWFTDPPQNTIGRITTSGVISTLHRLWHRQPN